MALQRGCGGTAAAAAALQVLLVYCSMQPTCRPGSFGSSSLVSRGGAMMRPKACGWQASTGCYGSWCTVPAALDLLGASPASQWAMCACHAAPVPTPGIVTLTLCCACQPLVKPQSSMQLQTRARPEAQYHTPPRQSKRSSCCPHPEGEAHARVPPGGRLQHVHVAAADREEET